jgi:hypothetical protein
VAALLAQRERGSVSGQGLVEEAEVDVGQAKGLVQVGGEGRIARELRVDAEPSIAPLPFLS